MSPLDRVVGANTKPLSKNAVKGASEAFEIPSTLSLQSHIILFANSFTNDFWVTPPQMVDVAEDTLNRAPHGCMAGARGPRYSGAVAAPIAHLPPPCVPPASQARLRNCWPWV